MAAYYHGGSEVQAEGMQTLHLMNTEFIRYPGGQAGPAALAPANWFVVDAAGNQENGGGFAGIPIVATAGPHLTPDSGHLFAPPHDAASILEFMSRLQYAPWQPVDSPAGAAVQSVIPADGDEGRQAHHHLLQRGLSLRLSTQGPDQYSLCQREQTTSAPVTDLMPTAGDDQGRVSPSSSGVSEGIAGVRGILMGSKYLRVAQELLDEVVSTGSVAEEKVMKGDMSEKETTTTMTSPNNPTPGQALGGGKQGAELTTSERQELLMKKAKLVSLLDEVKQRYRQYRQQMQVVVTAFEAAAGVGSAKPYTALALRTISMQFRCLRDAISGQIRATGRSLGEVGGSRLKLVDDRLRQHRALQQLGMMQHNAWRPQRGLPEKSVSILRAWLFENFLHPYPKDSDKTMLAKQTGLTRSQVSNWFINARVRLWKPMVEEMYTEEMKDQEQNQSNEDQKLSVSEAATSSPDQDPSPPEAEQMNNFQSKIGFIEQNNFPPPATIDQELDLETNFKKRRNDASLINCGTQLMDLKPSRAHNEEPIDGCSFNSYQQIGDMGRFDPQQFASSFGNGVVSLTLGLPQLSGAQQPYISNQNCMVMGRRIQIENEETDFFGMGTQQIVRDHTSASGYEKLDIQNSKPFAAQLWHDFVV